MRIRLALVGAAAVLTGCSVTPAPLGVVTQTASPRREALQYFPADAPVVGLVSSDPTDPGVRRLVSSGALDGLRDFLEAQKLRYAQYRSLLGNDAVIGQPDVGGPPLAVLVVPDSGYLASLADSRVRAGLAIRAGRYRGADFFQATGWAYAVRGPVLLIGGNVNQLVDALDTRVSEDSFDAGQMNAVLPESGVTDAVALAYVDLRPFLSDLVPAAAAQVPLVRSLTTGGLVVHAEPDRLEAALVADTSGTSLTGADLPGEPGEGTVRVKRDAEGAALGVADLATFLIAAERAVKSALPVTGLHIDSVFSRLQTAGVELSPALLAGPAWAVQTDDGPRVVWRPARRGPVALALQRFERNYREPGVRIVREKGLYTVTSHGRLVLRIGLVGRALVAGRAPAAALRWLASEPVERIPGRAVVKLPELVKWLPTPVSLALTGTADQVTLRVRTEP